MAHAALNATELAAQDQEQHASRTRDPAAEWVANAECHDRDAVALRGGQSPPPHNLAERRVW